MWQKMSIFARNFRKNKYLWHEALKNALRIGAKTN